MQDYQVMPELTAEEYAELKADIAERGVQVPIEFDQDMNVIDGYHRYKICQELGWIDSNGKIVNPDKVEWNVRIYDSEEAKFTQARKLNIARRHLTQEQLGKLVDDDIIANHETKSDRQIANDLGVSNSTVSDHHRQLVKHGDVCESHTVTDSLGRKQPRHKTPVIRHPSTRDAEAVRDPDIQRRLVENEGMNVAGAIREQRRDQLVERLDSVEAREAKAIEGVYDVIVVDPPWPMARIETDRNPHAVEMDYPTMSVEEIKNLKIPAADDCHVFLWATQKYLPDAFEIFEAWGVKYVCCFVWHKNHGHKPFGLPKFNCEFVLYGHIGSPQFVEETQFWACFEAPITVHSEKPEVFYDMIRHVTAGRRLDMFNRREIEGFDTWGKEAS